MNFNTSRIKPQLEHLMADYKRYLRYATEVKRDYVYNTFIEKLIKVLGWDPWKSDEYQLFTVNAGQEMFYGARLFVPDNKSIVVVHIDDSKLYEPEYLITQHLDMSFYVHLAFMAIEEKFSPDAVQLVWFTSIGKNYLYNYSDKSPHSFFVGNYDEFEKLQRSKITQQYGHHQLEGRSKEPGVKLAVWLYNWQARLSKSSKGNPCIYDLIDWLISVAMINQANIKLAESDEEVPEPDKSLFENLLMKYRLSQVKEFLLEIDFNHIFPKVYDTYRKNFNFQMYPGVEELPPLDNKMLAQFIEEIVCLSGQSLSFISLAHAYHILADDEIVDKLPKKSAVPDWLLPQPVLNRYVDISNKPADVLLESLVHIDGEDIALVMSLYDSLENMYASLNTDSTSSKQVKYELFSEDLFDRKQVVCDAPALVSNIACQIIGHNLRIVMPEPSKKRAITMLLIRKAITTMEKYSPSSIMFPTSIKFVR